VLSQEVGDGWRTLAEGGAGGVVNAATKQDANDFSVGDVEQTAAGPGPDGLVEDVHEPTCMVLNGASDDAGRGQWRDQSEGEPGECDVGAVELRSTFEAREGEMCASGLEALEGILNRAADSKVERCVALAGCETKPLDLDRFLVGVPAEIGEVDGWKAIGAFGGHLLGGFEHMIRSDETTFGVHEESAAEDVNDLNTLSLFEAQTMGTMDCFMWLMVSTLTSSGVAAKQLHQDSKARSTDEMYRKAAPPYFSGKRRLSMEECK
jgi:hypothetical protein